MSSSTVGVVRYPMQRHHIDFDIAVLTMMLSKRVLHSSLGLAKRQIVKSYEPVLLTGLRSFATTPRSAKTGDPNVEDDNILPVRIIAVKTSFASV